MANKFDLKTAYIQSTAATVPIVPNAGGAIPPLPAVPAVPAGKKLYVCMVKYGMTLGGSNITIGEGNAAGDTLEITKDIQIDLGALGTMVIPDNVDVDNPLFSIAAGKTLVYVGADADTEIIVTYFIE